MAKFDLVMKQRDHRRESGTGNHIHYQGRKIQDELISSISVKIVEEMVNENKALRYYPLFRLHSWSEQLSVTVRMLSLEDMHQIKEHFMGFLVPEKSTDFLLKAQTH